MTKKILYAFYALLILLCLGIAGAAGSFVTLSVGVNPVSANPGETVTATATLTSTADVSTATLTSTELVHTADSTYKISAPTISPMTGVQSGVAKTGTFTIAVPSKLAGTYTGTLTATDSANQANTISMLYSVTILPKTVFNITEKLTVASKEESSVSGKITITNTGSNVLAIASTDVSYNAVDFKDDELIIGLAFSSVTVNPGLTGEMTITATIPDKINLDTYDGVVTITKNSIARNFTLEIRVQPEVCEKGLIGDLEMDIEEPDDNDEYAPGESINLQVNVKNEANEDKDIIVEAFLYDIDDGDKIVDAKSDATAIGEDEDEDFSLTLDVPEDSDLDDEHNFVLYVKAYEKGDEDKQCSEEAIDIDIEREEHAMAISQFILSPTIATCGNVVDATVTIENTGSKDEDGATARLLNTQLGINLVSESFDVDRATKKDNDYTVRFTFTVPQITEQKDYEIEAAVTYDDGDGKKSGFATLKIANCAPVAGTATNVVLEIADVGGELKEGKTISIPAKLTNNEIGTQTYKISLENIGIWAKAVPDQTLTLANGESQTAYFYIKPQEDLDEGIYTAVVNVKSGSNIIATKTLSFEVKAKEGLFSGAGKWFEGTSAFWIIGDIVLIVVAVFFIKLIFTGKRRPKEVKL